MTERVLKLVTQKATDQESVTECLKDALQAAEKMQATDVFVILRGDDGENFTGYWTENNRIIGLLAAAQFDLLAEQFGVFEAE